MRPRIVCCIITLVALATLVASCGSARRSEPIVGPIALAPEAARGEQVFMRHCHECHPKGEAGLAPSLNDKPLPGWLIRFQVRNGLGTMPSFDEDEIGPAELDELIAYLQAVRSG